MTARISSSPASPSPEELVLVHLRTVLERRSAEPHQILGLGPNATPAEARAAFLVLCKRFHPSKFARSAPETLRLANEAFLIIKRAFETLGRTTETLRVVPSATSTPRAPVVASGSTPVAARTSPVRPAGQASTERVARIDAPGQAGSLDEAAMLDRGLDLLRRRRWNEAEALFGQLALHVPAEKRYRAHRHYARGRVCQDLGRHDEARAEWRRALTLDPGLTAARTAIAQLPDPEPVRLPGRFAKIFGR